MDFVYEDCVNVPSSDEDEEILLPIKSREKYQAVYDSFIQWKTAQNINLITENVILSYFGELANKYKPPTLWSHYSMLRSTMQIHDKIKLENFKQLVAFLKHKSIGYQAKESSVFSANEIKMFLDEAPDSQYMLTKARKTDL